MSPDLWTAIITGIVSIIVAVLAGGGLVRLTMRRQLSRLTEAETIAKEATASSTLATAAIAQVESYRLTVEELRGEVEQYRTDLRGSRGELDQIQWDLSETVRRLAATEAELKETHEELAATLTELQSLRDSHHLSQQELDRLSQDLRETRKHQQQCEEDRASLQAELEILRGRLQTIGQRQRYEEGRVDGD